MASHSDLTDIEFKKQFINYQLSPADFTHEAHLRLAWININDSGIHQAESNIQNQLQKFVAFVGAKNKYNKTLTIAALKAVNHFMLKSKSDNFNDFILEFPRLKSHFKELISCHYSFDIYNSARAKKEFLQPDLAPFD